MGIWADISLSRIEKNGALVKKRAGTKLIAVVKDDGYGHGGEAVSHALHGIADAFAVATVREGAALRVAGVSEEILVLAPVLNEEEALGALCYGLCPAVSSFASFKRAESVFRGCGARVQLAVNTGMNRYGFRLEDLPAVCRRAREEDIVVSGCFSHFYCAADAAARESQFALFSAAAERVKAFFPAAVCHLSATGGILAGKKYNFDAVRSGIALYGYLPEGFEGELGVLPAAKFYAAVSHRTTAVGEGAGYRRAEKRYGHLYTLRAGYGDGLFRTKGLGVGDLCMDACVCEGDAPFGRRARILSDLAGYARAHGTSVYEVLVSVLGRAEKRYV